MFSVRYPLYIWVQLFKAIFCFECALLEESESGHWILQHLPTIRLSVRASCISVTICSRYQETIITVYYFIKLCLLLWFKIFKTMLSGLRDFSVWFREIILESTRIQSANCHWWHFFPTVTYFGNQRQTNRGWVIKFQEYVNCFDWTFVIPCAHVSALLSLTVFHFYFSCRQVK